jgi:hypothetical protein
MADDRSLDEFLESGDSDDDEEANEGGEGNENRDAASAESAEQAESDGEASEDAGTAQSVDPAAVDPATTTYDWEPGGGACTVCGERVNRRWESEDGLVCQACKEW